jgi:hypothetical protein
VGGVVLPGVLEALLLFLAGLLLAHRGRVMGGHTVAREQGSHGAANDQTKRTTAGARARQEPGQRIKPVGIHGRLLERDERTLGHVV